MERIPQEEDTYKLPTQAKPGHSPHTVGKLAGDDTYKLPAQPEAHTTQQAQVWPVRRSPSSYFPIKRVPQLYQMSMVECGIACLAMVLSYYGRKTSISELRSHCQVSRDGLSALSIVQAARSYGMRVRAVSLRYPDFRNVILPAIVHWQFNHYLVVERWSKKYVGVVDPAYGRRRLTSTEFDAGFTGVVIMLEPGALFNQQNTSACLSLRSYLLQYARRTPGTLLQVLLASLLLQMFGLTFPLLTKVVLDQVLRFKMDTIMPLLALGMLMLVLAQIVTTLLRSSLLVYLQARLDSHMMLNFFEHLLTLPYSFFQQRSSGDMLARLASNNVIRDLLSNQLIATLLDGSTVMLYLVVLLWQSRSFALLTLLIGGLQAILLLSTRHALRELAMHELTAQGRSQGYIAEALSGIATLKAAGAEHRALEHWSNLFFEQLNISIRRSYLSATVDTALNALRSCAPLALLWLGTTQALNGSISTGTMFALNALALSFLSPLGSLVESLQKLQLVHAHFGRLADVMSAQPEQAGKRLQATPRLSGHIRLEQVSFQYTPDGPTVLQNINVTIAAGQKVALVGRTGSGKSTLGKLLLGLHLPTTGTIFYDTMPLQSLNYQEVRRQFGTVMQETTLFSGSVLQNILLNDPTLDPGRVVQAAKAAAIHEDIMQMPMGYETFVAEGGSALSGGQRQRLAIARALAHQPAILLLDEATSHLDVLTEQKVENNLRAIACTQIIIAHRLSTIRNADLILVLDQGRIVEQGSHSQLLQQNGYYARLVQSQMESRSIDEA